MKYGKFLSISQEQKVLSANLFFLKSDIVGHQQSTYLVQLLPILEYAHECKFYGHLAIDKSPTIEKFCDSLTFSVFEVTIIHLSFEEKLHHIRMHTNNAGQNKNAFWIYTHHLLFLFIFALKLYLLKWDLMALTQISPPTFEFWHSFFSWFLFCNQNWVSEFIILDLVIASLSKGESGFQNSKDGGKQSENLCWS